LHRASAEAKGERIIAVQVTGAFASCL
jgi:hypothetical protein